MLKPNIKKILKHILISVVALSLFIELALMVMYGFLLVPWVPPFVIHIRNDGPSPQANIDPPPVTFTHPIYPADPTK